MPRTIIECPGCNQQVAMMGSKPMSHYIRGTNNLCAGTPPPCKACKEIPESVQDLASVAATGVCYGCSH